MEKGKKARVLERLDGLKLHNFKYGSIVEFNGETDRADDEVYFFFEGISEKHGSQIGQWLDELEFQWVE